MTLDFSESRWPPFAHQREDTQSFIEQAWFFIASEMRTGKTKIVIDGAQFMYRANIIDRVIVVAPEPVRSVWADKDGGELFKHLFLSTSALITEFCSHTVQWRFGPPSDTPFRWIVTNYEFLRPYRRKNESKKTDDNLKALLKYCGPKTLLVLDESSAVTNHKSSTYKACHELRKKCGRVVLMDGTPMDTPMNLFATGNMLHPSILDCGYITHYRNRYAEMGGFSIGAVRKRDPKTGKVTFEGGRPTQVIGWKNLDDLQRRFAPYTVRRLQAQCLDLPPKLPAVTLKAVLDTEWPYYVAMRDEMIVQLESGNASIAQQAITKLMRLSQITGGFLGGVEDAGLDIECESCAGTGCATCEGSGIGAAAPVEPTKEIGRAKLDVALWLIERQLNMDPSLKIIMWTRFSPEVRRLLREVEQRFPTMIVAGLHGGQSKKDRKAVKALLKPETAPPGPVFVGGTLGTGSFGLDFSASHTSVNYSYTHSLRKFLQSGDRVYGPGQVAPIDYFDIVAVGPKGQKTYDSVIVQARRTKQDLATWTTDAWVKALKEE